VPRNSAIPRREYPRTRCTPFAGLARRWSQACQHYGRMP
jgi:hypothetical protein